MRSLLFRIWDKQNLSFLRSGVEPFTPVVDLGAWQDESRWVISQFTGFTDANGVGIWEGDIVRDHYSSGNLGPTGLVRWTDGGDYACRGGWTSQPARLFSGTGDNPTHIIGNQWQHPSLLT